MRTGRNLSRVLDHCCSSIVILSTSRGAMYPSRKDCLPTVFTVCRSNFRNFRNALFLQFFSSTSYSGKRLCESSQVPSSHEKREQSPHANDSCCPVVFVFANAQSDSGISLRLDRIVEIFDG